MDPNEPDGTAGAQDKPLGRGLEDVSHLFLSRKTADASASDRATARSPEPSSAPPGSRGGVALLRPAPITRDRLAAALMEFDGALEEGLRAFDAKIPCPSCGEIGHFDWVVRNMPNVRRMYREQVVNFSLPPRLFLLAPQFSPLLRSVARQITRPQIHWVRYHTVDASGGPGILFEPVVDE